MIQTTFRIPEKLYKELKSEAGRKGLSINALLLNILWKWADRAAG